MTGTVVTFYSLGRAMDPAGLTANVASVLQDWGHRVLCIDWDADDPRLSAALGRWSADQDGLSELIQDFLAGTPRRTTNYFAADPQSGLVLLGSRKDTATDWEVLYQRHRLADFLEDCRAQWVEDFDFVLIKSPPGYHDAAAICAAQLADRLVVLHDLDELSDVVDVVAQIEVARDRMPYDRPQLLTLPVWAAYSVWAVPRARNEARAKAEQAAFAALTRNWVHRDTPTTDIHERLKYSQDPNSTQSIAELITQITADDQEEVLVALRAILGRDLDGPRWELVASTLDDMLSAVDDAAALSDLALHLSLVGVVRGLDPGQGPITGPPDLVRQKVAQLLAELDARR